jgi:hypothetical protein
MDYTEMRAFQYREENGILPDEVYTPTEEDDLSDPEQVEIIEHVMDGYRLTNEKRRAERDRIRISVLEQLLTEHGIEIPEL